ncbi:MAG: HIT domain-containing protein [Phycisphaerales bacterium]|nr:MAG: HIT domain-containing protein [Phycisphaerales bacterium]
MADFNTNLWAPWRMEYIRSLEDELDDDGCFLCRYWEQPERDRENRVVRRTSTALVVMNRFPYTTGHLLIAQGKHEGDFGDLTDDELGELNQLIRDSVALLRRTVEAQGFNVGYNLGKCAGAGLPDHLHAHVVPRWLGDTNVMSVVGDCRVIPESLDALYAELLKNL